MESDESTVHEPDRVEDPEIATDLHLDWTEAQEVDADTILWLATNGLPPNVSGVDRSRARSEGEAVS